uniref:Uncharacterized protein n=1 Tax=Panagrolaimus sp. JU765 TaxID=591449 RepID=A0AC34R5K9_9BILA
MTNYTTPMNSYGLLEIDIEDNLDFDYGDSLLSTSTKNLRKTKFSLPTKLPELTINSFDLDYDLDSNLNEKVWNFETTEMFDPLFCFETQCQINSPLNNHGNDGEFPFDGHDSDFEKDNPDEATI